MDKAAARSTFAAAIDIAKSIESDDYFRSQALASIAESQAKSGDFDAAIENNETILVKRNVHLYNIARAMVQVGDREQFKRILITLAQDLYTAYKVAGLLFEAYKDQSRCLSKVIRLLI